jgi:hypothetical protein
MDLPCPKCHSTDLQKVSLVCEEVPYGCENVHGSTAFWSGAVVREFLQGPRQRREQGRRRAPHKAVGWGHIESAGILQRTCYPSKHSLFKSPSRRALLKVCRPHAGKNRVAARTFRAES